MFNMIEEVLEDLQKGKIICLADNEDLENEIDMMCLAKYASTENINYMIKNARGLVCCAMDDEACERLGLEPMIYDNAMVDRLGTPFYQSLDLNNGSTGVSAVHRGRTARRIATATARLSDFVSPGHLFTLRVKPGLLKERLGHTEGSVTLAKMCEQIADIICEIIKDNGEMLTLKDFKSWNKNKNLKLLSIEQLM